jgi:hypothetical protein
LNPDLKLDPRPPLLWAVVTTVLCGVAMSTGMALDWPGQTHTCAMAPYCYCERVQPGPIGQPANTWSNLGFVAAGLWIGWDATRRRRWGRTNPYLDDWRFPALYASVVVFLGPGSMFFHGGMTEWGGRVDGYSMYLFILYVIAYDISRARAWPWGPFGCLYLGLIVLFGLERAFGMGPSVPIFAGLVTVAVLLEVWIALPPRLGALGRRQLSQADLRVGRLRPGR